MSALQRRMLAASALLLAVACKDSTSPNTVDPVDLENSLNTTTQIFQNAAFQSVSALEFTFPQFVAAGITMPSLSQVLKRSGLHVRAAHRPAPTAAIISGTQALFPSNVLGKTLEWDTASGSYVIGSLTGAPSNGIRILLYVADANLGTPVKPLSVLGYLELTDVSTAQVNEIGVLLKLASTTIAQYTVTANIATNSGTIEAKGFMKDGTATHQVTFDLLDVAAPDTTFTFTNDLTGDDGGAVHIVITAPPSGNDNVLARISRGGNSLELNVTGQIGNPLSDVTGTVKFNGVTVANVTGSALDPAILGTNGHTITAAQSAALLAIFDSALTTVLDISDGILAPSLTVFHG